MLYQYQRINDDLTLNNTLNDLDEKRNSVTLQLYKVDSQYLSYLSDQKKLFCLIKSHHRNYNALFSN